MKQPNLVYIFADQFRYFSCDYAGDRLAHTPNIDQLAAEAVDLHNAISDHPLCMPYRGPLDRRPDHPAHRGLSGRIGRN